MEPTCSLFVYTTEHILDIIFGVIHLKSLQNDINFKKSQMTFTDPRSSIFYEKINFEMRRIFQIITYIIIFEFHFIFFLHIKGVYFITNVLFHILESYSQFKITLCESETISSHVYFNDCGKLYILNTFSIFIHFYRWMVLIEKLRSTPRTKGNMQNTPIEIYITTRTKSKFYSIN